MEKTMSNQATPDHGKAASGKGAPPGATQAQNQKALEDRFSEVGADRFMFNANKGCTGKLTGYLLNEVEMPEIERGNTKQEWKCLLVLTTAPCKAIGRDKAIHDVPAGAEVLVPGTFKLSDTFEKAALHPTQCYEVQIIPLEKIDIGKGQTMWLYKLGIDKRTIKARSEFGLAGVLAAPSNVKALSAGTAESVGAAGEDTPF
jgi:hypothetical protein